MIRLRNLLFTALSLVTCLSLLGCGGPPTPQKWTKLLGGIDDDIAYSIAVDASGNVFITGITYGNLDGHTNNGVRDIFIAKYDISGNKRWVKLLGTAGDELAHGIALDGAGNIYITGGTDGNLDGQINAGYYDAFIAKFDSSGNKQWVRLFGTPEPEFAHGIAVDASGNAYVTGYTYGSLNDQTNAGAVDIFIVKYDSSGNRQWAKLLGSDQDDDAREIALDTSGNVYITGVTYGNLDGQTNAGGGDVFIAKYDSTGNKQWVKLLSTFVPDIAESIAVDASANVYITGRTIGSFDDQITAGVLDIFIAKYDSSGTKQWVKMLGSHYDESGYGVAVDPSGNAYITGTTAGDLDGQKNAGQGDIFMAAYDSSGNRRWVKLLGTAEDEAAIGIVVDASRNIFITGMTIGNLNRQTNAGGADVFIIRDRDPGI